MMIVVSGGADAKRINDSLPSKEQQQQQPGDQSLLVYLLFLHPLLPLLLLLHIVPQLNKHFLSFFFWSMSELVVGMNCPASSAKQ